MPLKRDELVCLAQQVGVKVGDKATVSDIEAALRDFCRERGAQSDEPTEFAPRVSLPADRIRVSCIPLRRQNSIGACRRVFSVRRPITCTPTEFVLSLGFEGEGRRPEWWSAQVFVTPTSEATCASPMIETSSLRDEVRCGNASDGLGMSLCVQIWWKVAWGCRGNTLVRLSR
jgi:hypothetical protein